jgi:ribonuclease J
LRIIPLGGCGEFGMNVTCYLTGGKLIVVDCGLRFTDPTKLGTDAVVPAVDEWFEQAGGVYAYLITHAHEDHIGALPYILPRWPAPVYTTPWTAEVLRIKYAKRGLDEKKHPITTVRPGDHVRAPGFDAEWVHVNHSIPDACALYIRTPAVSVFHTGDFKFDATPIIEKPMTDERLAAIGELGVDLLLSDSTNAEKRGGCPSEASVFEPLVRAFRSCEGAIVLSTFASNLWRLKTVADVCLATGRRIYITGPGIDQSFAIAQQLGMYEIPAGLRVTDETLGAVPREKLVVLATGCQGEFRSAMNRIAHGEHRQFKIQRGDTVILSSRIIPGNERPILIMIDQLKRHGARILTTRDDDGIHVSGHAYRGDLERLFRLLKPRWYTPVHGAFSQLDANRSMGEELGLKPERAVLIENGDVIDVTKEKITIRERLQIDLEYIDSDTGTTIPHEVLRERLRVGELGGAVLTGVYDGGAGSWLVPPQIELLGLRLPFGVDQDAWLKRQAAAVRDIVRDRWGEKGVSADDVRESARIGLRRALLAVLKKKPVVIVKLHFV